MVSCTVKSICQKFLGIPARAIKNHRIFANIVSYLVSSENENLMRKIRKGDPKVRLCNKFCAVASFLKTQTYGCVA